MVVGTVNQDVLAQAGEPSLDVWQSSESDDSATLAAGWVLSPLVEADGVC